MASRPSSGSIPAKHEYKEVERIQVGEVAVIFTERPDPDLPGGVRHSFGFFKEYSQGGVTKNSPYFSQKHVEALEQLAPRISAVLKKLRAASSPAIKVSK